MSESHYPMRSGRETPGPSYDELLAEDRALPVDTPRTAAELRRQALNHIFQPGEEVVTIGPGGAPQKARVLAIEPRLNTTEHRYYDYVKLAYDVPVHPDPRFGTRTVTEEVRADKLAVMQLSEAEIAYVSPDPANIGPALRGEATVDPVAAALDPAHNTLGHRIRTEAAAQHQTDQARRLHDALNPPSS